MVFHSAGIKIGHATLEKYHTGCTVFLCPPETVGSVDVRGPAPGSRESALLQLDKPISYLNAVVLTGGSAFGLAAADGVMRYCAEHNIGHQTPVRPIPIVPAAVVYDLFMGDGRHLPDADLGYAAAVAATENNDAQGNIGAGAGVSVGKWAGFENAMKSGFGTASFEKDGLVVMATAVTNAVGDVVNSDGTVLAGARSDSGWMADKDPFRHFAARPPVQMTNTTLVVVGTNARLTKIEANRLAQRAHDGMAIAIRPIHTTHDGDTAFALATGKIDAGFDIVANIAVEMVAEAIRNSVRYAHTVGGWPGLAGDGTNVRPTI
ncbi:MAG: P1 family peptidase [Candidatus Promineifilaceae bacterium]